jgi:hypothetical protein
VLVLVLAALFPAGQVVALVHETSVRHVVCADHGELTHASGAGQVARDGEHDAPAVRADGSSTSHEHCAQAGVVTQFSPQLPPVASAAPQVIARALGEPVRYVAPGTRLLLTAPKTSPPRA